MKVYWAFLRLRFAVQLQYRAAAIAGLITNFFFGLVRAMVFVAFYALNLQPQPMTLEQAVTYSWLTEATFRLLPWTRDSEVLAQIRSGNVAYELCRPLNLYLNWYCRLIALRVAPTLLGSVPLLIFACLLPGDIRAGLPVSPVAGLAWLAATLVALLLSCSITNLIAISTFWTTTGDGLIWILPAIAMILSGTIVPLAFFPDWLQSILKILPFAGLLDIPARFYSGLLPVREVFQYLALELAWTGFFVVLGLRLIAAGMQRVVIQGG
jgi:ABC-2 type transport system permease protein